MSEDNHRYHPHHDKKCRTFKLTSNDSTVSHLFSIEFDRPKDLFEKLKKRIESYSMDFAKIFWIDPEEDHIYLEKVSDLKEALRFSKRIVRLFFDSEKTVKLGGEEDHYKSDTSSFTEISEKESNVGEVLKSLENFVVDESDDESDESESENEEETVEGRRGKHGRGSHGRRGRRGGSRRPRVLLVVPVPFWALKKMFNHGRHHHHHRRRFNDEEEL